MKIIKDKDLRKLIKAILEETEDDKKAAKYTPPDWAKPVGQRTGSPRIPVKFYPNNDGDGSFGQRKRSPAINNIKIYDRKREPVTIYPSRNQPLPYDEEDEIPTKYIPGA
jgi:hypothetical protein